jgi:hypothetical protein
MKKIWQRIRNGKRQSRCKSRNLDRDIKNELGIKDFVEKKAIEVV